MKELPGIHRIRLPMANNPLRYVNSYLIEGGDGHLLIDCGWDTPDVLAALEKALDDLDLRPQDVRTLLATHFHTDHYGLAGTLKQLWNPTLLMHRADWLHVRTQYSDLPARIRLQADWLARNGLPDRSWREEDQQSLANLRRFSMVPPDRELEAGATIEAGQYRFQVLLTPGHTEGHICLYDAEHRVLLSGDHVLDPITPRVSVSIPSADNPLGAYLESLERMAVLEADVVLPGHGRPFTGLRRRVGELLAHHRHREAVALAALAEGPKTAAEVAEHLTWLRQGVPFSQLSAFLQRMALGETLAHLAQLRVLGHTIAVPRNGRIYYESS